MTNPYGDGHAAEKIVQVLTTTSLTEDLIVKHAGPPRPGRSLMKIPLSAPDITEAEIEAVVAVFAYFAAQSRPRD